MDGDRSDRIELMLPRSLSFFLGATSNLRTVMLNKIILRMGCSSAVPPPE